VATAGAKYLWTQRRAGSQTSAAAAAAVAAGAASWLLLLLLLLLSRFINYIFHCFVLYLYMRIHSSTSTQCHFAAYQTLL
jgi:hypothetical protein